MAEGETRHDRKKRLIEVHLQTGGGRRGNKSKTRKETTEYGVLTHCGQQRKGQVRRWKRDWARCTHRLERAEGVRQKESERVRYTHHLEIAEGGTSQDPY